MSRPDRLGNKARKTIAAFFLTRGSKWRTRSDAKSLGHVSICVLARRGVSIAEIRRYVDIVLTVPPLSKFGLTYNVEVVAERQWRDGRFFAPVSGKRWFVYTSGKFHAYSRSASRVELPTLVTVLAETDQSPFPPIVSTLKADVNSPPAD